ncbi:MAG: HAD family phosphatase [Atopostipes suicloacalis]|nr:HAD family phosphatase [Atopostipes suicloacalis]
MSQIKAVIFDMDGLMFDTEPIYYKANQKTADYLGMDFSFDTYTQFIGMGEVDYKEGMRQLYKDEKLLDEFFIKSNQVLEYLFFNGEIDMKEGLIELLEYLKNEDIPAVLASSSGKKLVKELLDRLELKEYFKDMIAGDEVERAKPDPAIFNEAFKKTGIKEKKEVLVLEDSKNGVLAAKDAKIPVIMIPDLLKADKEVKEKALDVYPNLKEVIHYIDKKNK